MKVLTESVVPARTGKAFLVKRHQHIRVLQLEGHQVGDFVVFNANNLRERFNQARTKANLGKITVTTGDRLYSKLNNVLLTITEDTYGFHDLQYGMCSKWVFESPEYHGFTSAFSASLGGPYGRPTWGCWENLIDALKDWKIADEDIPDPLNIFQTTAIYLGTGTMGIIPDRTKPGDHIDFRAEMDCLAALSACPTGGRPMKVQVYEE